MHRLIIFAVLFAGFAAAEVRAQATANPPAQKLAEEWLNRLNSLEAWHLSFDGKEDGLDQVVSSFMELFANDVIAEVPPHDEEQIGPVMLRGSENFRKWVYKIARTQVRLNYLMKRQTGGPAGEYEGWQIIHSVPLPWGGQSISFQIIATYSLRENRRRFTGPGAVFLQYGNDGKIHRLRLLTAETAEVVQQ